MLPLGRGVPRGKIMQSARWPAVKSSAVESCMPKVAARILQTLILELFRRLKERDILLLLDPYQLCKLESRVAATGRTPYLHDVRHWIPFICAGHD